MINPLMEFAVKLWPLNRSITGAGLRETLKLIQSKIPTLEVFSVPTGTRCFDWEIPKEWVIDDAYIVDPDGNKFCEFSQNNLHLIGYSEPFSGKVSLEELQDHLYSIPELPDAIPYVTSYYEKRWGFCIEDNKRKNLKPGDYQVVINSSFISGELNYGVYRKKGKLKEEILFSTYICHPSMANNELSGPVVLTFLSEYLQNLDNNKYTYRILFIPETIGSIAFLSKNLKYLKKWLKAGFNITCIGDERSYSFLPTRHGNTYSDKIAKSALKSVTKDFKTYSWLDRGSDERQFCAPGIDLPVASIMRSKYGEYKEYHNSLDKLGTVVTENGLSSSLQLLKNLIDILESDCYPIAVFKGEPNLGKRNLYPTLSQGKLEVGTKLLKDVLSYSDGKISILDMAEICGVSVFEIKKACDQLLTAGLIRMT